MPHALTGDMFTTDIVAQRVGSPYTRSGPLDVFDERLSGTSAAVVLAAQRQARARGLLPNDRQLSVAALSTFVKRTAGQQEVTSAGEVLNFAREVGLVRADQASGGRFQGTPAQWQNQHIVFYDYVFLGIRGLRRLPTSRRGASGSAISDQSWSSARPIRPSWKARPTWINTRARPVRWAKP